MVRPGGLLVTASGAGGVTSVGCGPAAASFSSAVIKSRSRSSAVRAATWMAESIRTSCRPAAVSSIRSHASRSANPTTACVAANRRSIARVAANTCCCSSASCRTWATAAGSNGEGSGGNKSIQLWRRSTMAAWRLTSGTSNSRRDELPELAVWGNAASKACKPCNDCCWKVAASPIRFSRRLRIASRAAAAAPPCSACSRTSASFALSAASPDWSPSVVARNISRMRSTNRSKRSANSA